MLRLEGIHTFYGPIEALRGIDLEIGKGEIVSLIGSNGAGKSTCLMTISGVLKPPAGKIFLNDCRHNRPAAPQDRLSRHKPGA